MSAFPTKDVIFNPKTSTFDSYVSAITGDFYNYFMRSIADPHSNMDDLHHTVAVFSKNTNDFSHYITNKIFSSWLEGALYGLLSNVYRTSLANEKDGLELSACDNVSPILELYKTHPSNEHDHVNHCLNKFFDNDLDNTYIASVSLKDQYLRNIIASRSMNGPLVLQTRFGVELNHTNSIVVDGDKQSVSAFDNPLVQLLYIGMIYKIFYVITFTDNYLVLAFRMNSDMNGKVNSDYHVMFPAVQIETDKFQEVAVQFADKYYDLVKLDHDQVVSFSSRMLYNLKSMIHDYLASTAMQRFISEFYHEVNTEHQNKISEMSKKLKMAEAGTQTNSFGWS